MIWSIIGISAAVLTMFSFVPQVVKILRTKAASNVSLITLLQLSCGVFLWMLYGLHLRDAIIIIANGVTLITLVYAIILYFHFR